LVSFEKEERRRVVTLTFDVFDSTAWNMVSNLTAVFLKVNKLMITPLVPSSAKQARESKCLVL
jgi:hypothetical protein